MSRRVWMLAPEEMADLVLKYFVSTNPVTRTQFIELVEPIIEEYKERPE